MGRRTPLNIGIAGTLAIGFVACGGGGGSSPTAPSPGGGTVATITIGSNGVVSPKDITVSVGSRVTFVNNHSRPHEMSSDPHPEHTLCPELNVGTLSSGQSRTSANLNTARVCTYHDHLEDGNTNLQGTVRVQ